MFSFSFSANSNPLMSGNKKSRITRLGENDFALSKASTPVWASTQASKPLPLSKSVRSCFREVLSSPTINTVRNSLTSVELVHPAFCGAIQVTQLEQVTSAVNYIEVRLKRCVSNNSAFSNYVSRR